MIIYLYDLIIDPSDQTSNSVIMERKE